MTNTPLIKDATKILDISNNLRSVSISSILEKLLLIEGKHDHPNPIKGTNRAHIIPLHTYIRLNYIHTR